MRTMTPAQLQRELTVMHEMRQALPIEWATRLVQVETERDALRRENDELRTRITELQARSAP